MVVSFSVMPQMAPLFWSLGFLGVWAVLVLVMVSLWWMMGMKSYMFMYKWGKWLM